MTGNQRLVVRFLAVCGSTFAILVLFFVFVYRPWQLNWGASQEEVRRAMPGDEIVVNPTFNATRAVTIETSPENVWPWLVQMGYLRAGFYSHDRLDNDGVPSAETILPEYQDLAVGDTLPLTGRLDAEVRTLERHRSMLWVFGPSDSQAPAAASAPPGLDAPIAAKAPPGAEASPESPYNLWTWSWGLYPTNSGQTRLVARLRVRARFRRTLFLDLFEIVMMRKCLLEIKRRAEALAAAGH